MCTCSIVNNLFTAINQHFCEYSHAFHSKGWSFHFFQDLEFAENMDVNFRKFILELGENKICADLTISACTT